MQLTEKCALKAFVCFIVILTIYLIKKFMKFYFSKKAAGVKITILPPRVCVI